jgi:dihydrofolate reductase
MISRLKATIRIPPSRPRLLYRPVSESEDLSTLPSPARLPFRLHAIAAMASNRVIGRRGALPWHLPEDLRLFKSLTLGHPIIMGRRTWESLGRPLPGRQNIVVSRVLTAADAPGATVVADTRELAHQSLEGDAYLIGGGQLYEKLFPLCSSLFLTYVFHAYDGDTLLPEFEHLFTFEKTLESTAAFEQRLYLRKSTTDS